MFRLVARRNNSLSLQINLTAVGPSDGMPTQNPRAPAAFCDRRGRGEKDDGEIYEMASRSLMVPTTQRGKAFRFALVGLTGIIVNQTVLASLAETVGLHYLLAAIAATQISSTSNFLLTDYWAFAGRRSRWSQPSRYLAFMGLNNATLVLRVPVLWFLADVAGLHYLVANLMTLAVTFGARFLFADGWIWSATSASPAPFEPLQTNSPRRVRETPDEEDPTIQHAHQFFYDVAGVIGVDSSVEILELAYFRTPAIDKVDIRIRTVRVGAFPSLRTRFVQKDNRLSYLEQPGIAGANFRITMGSPIEIEVAPLLARSRHVLYTNVLEALLRFQLVARGHVLLHSACMLVDGKAVLLSAQTDTGKTSTVIQLVRDHGYEFLSDDMTIIAPDGRAICYPKPMTLSYHTMSSIKGGDLRRRQRVALAIQSRLHSKSGRTVGRFLGRLNIPIMSVNSVVQILVPPPKYRIDALLSCTVGGEAPIGHVFLMERGDEFRHRISSDDAIAQLIENTDDAYGFPPFATFAPYIRINGDDYSTLRDKEEAILRSALRRANVWRVSVPGHGWAELLPALINASPSSVADPETSALIPFPIHVMTTEAAVAEVPVSDAS